MADKKDDKPQERIIFSSDLYWGIPLYIKNDPIQDEYTLVEITLLPGVTNSKSIQVPAVQLRLKMMKYLIWVYDFEVSTVRDEEKWQRNRDSQKRDDDDDEGD